MGRSAGDTQPKNRQAEAEASSSLAALEALACRREGEGAHVEAGKQTRQSLTSNMVAARKVDALLARVCLDRWRRVFGACVAMG